MAIKINGTTVISDSQAITSTSTISATGNITGSYIIGNGSQLTGLPAGYTNANLASLGSSVISTSGNITGGNINVGNITIATDLISSLGATITIDPATAGNAGHVVINGNLQVNGTTTTINSNVVSTNDLTVNYANNAINSSAANGGGIEVGPIGTPYITWLYNSTANVFTSSGGISAVGNITGGNLSVTGIAGTLSTAAQTSITSVGTLGSLTVTANVTGGNILTGGLVSAAGTITGTSHLGAVVSVTANVTGGNLLTAGLISATGAITGAAITGSSLTVSTGNISGGNIVNNNSNGVGNIGSATTYFNTVFAKATSAQYADLAELYTADAEYEPGTVVEFGGAAEVTLSNKPGSTRVAGVVSTNPSYIMNATLQAEHVAVVALQGRVPCKVIGPVSKGDIMVASGGGYAKVDNNAKAGTIIGKALEVLHTPHGIIEVVVGRN